MDKIEKVKPPLFPFMAASLAPVATFVLANALFLPLVLAVVDPSGSFLNSLIPSNIPGSGYLGVAGLVILVYITGAAVLIGPALTVFFVNLLFPILTTLPMALWSGLLFFFSHSVLVVILVVVRNSTLPPTPPNYPDIFTLAIDPLPIVGLLTGIVLSCSVALFGWLGARIRRKKS
jgi:hypothetical protein